MDIYVTGRIENNVMRYAAYNMDFGYIDGSVPATSEIEGQLYSIGAVLIKSLEKKWNKWDSNVNIHTDLETAVKFANGKYKPIGDVARRFVKKIKSLAKSKDCEFSFDTSLSKERADKLFELTYAKDDKKIEKPLAKKKREVQPNRVYQNWITSKPKDLYTADKHEVSEKDNLSALEQEEQELWDWYFEQAEKERLQKVKENAEKQKEEKTKEKVPYNDNTYVNFVNSVYKNKEVEYDENDVNWRIKIYDKSGNCVFDFADRPYPGQTRDGVIVSRNDWTTAVWQGCFNEQVNGYTVKREGKIDGENFDGDTFKYFFIFGKDGNILGTLSANRKNLLIERKIDNQWHYFYAGKIEFDFANVEESSWKKFAGVDFEEAKRLFNEFFDTISNDCKLYINKFYEKNKEEQERKEDVSKKSTIGEYKEVQEKTEFESENEDKDRITFFNL